MKSSLIVSCLLVLAVLAFAATAFNTNPTHANEDAGKEAAATGRTLDFIPLRPLKKGGPGEIRGSLLSAQILRAKIPGGWLVTAEPHTSTGGAAITFVPDAEHRWDGASLQ